MNVYVGTDSLKNAYIGEVWTPGSNTIAYYPLENNTNDYSGNNRNLTNSGITFSDNVGVFNGSAKGYYANQSLFGNLQSFTYSVYVNPSQIPSGTYNNNPLFSVVMSIANNAGYDQYDKSIVLYYGSQCAGYNYYNGTNYVNATGISTNTWYNIVYTFDGSTMKIYKNGTLSNSIACGGSYTGYTAANLLLGTNGNFGNYIKAFYGKLSKVIVENIVWTADEISHYYNLTKSNYGL